MIKKFVLATFILLSFVSKSFSNEFIGVIGVAVGDINNQKNEKLINGSKVFFGDTIFVAHRNRPIRKIFRESASSFIVNVFEFQAHDL